MADDAEATAAAAAGEEREAAPQAPQEPERVSETKAKYGGIFPPGGVEAANTENAEEDVRIKEKCRALFYSMRCADKVDPLQANAVISEMANVIKRAGAEYDCARLDNLSAAIERIINNKLSGAECLPIRFLEGITESYPLTAVKTKDKDCPDGFQLSAQKKENTLLSTATPRTVYGANPVSRFVPVSSSFKEWQDNNDAMRDVLSYYDATIGANGNADTLRMDLLAQNMLCRHAFYAERDTLVQHNFIDLIPSLGNDIGSSFPGQGGWPQGGGIPNQQNGWAMSVRLGILVNGTPNYDWGGRGCDYKIYAMNTSISSTQLIVSGSCVYWLPAGFVVIETYRMPHFPRLQNAVVKFLMYDLPGHQSVREEISIYSGNLQPFPKPWTRTPEIAARRLQEARGRVLPGMWTGTRPSPQAAAAGASFVSFAEKLALEAQAETSGDDGKIHGYSPEYLARLCPHSGAPGGAAADMEAEKQKKEQE